MATVESFSIEPRIALRVETEVAENCSKGVATTLMLGGGEVTLLWGGEELGWYAKADNVYQTVEVNVLIGFALAVANRVSPDGCGSVVQRTQRFAGSY